MGEGTTVNEVIENYLQGTAKSFGEDELCGHSSKHHQH